MHITAIKQMEALSKQIPGVISLSQGIPAGFSHEIIRQDVIKAMLDNKVDKYSEVPGILPLREKISEKLQEEGINYSIDTGIIVTTGGMEALSASMLSIIDPGDEVIVVCPTYSYYYKIIDLVRAKAVNVILNEEDDWDLDIEYLKSKITKKTKALIICNPNNPTGNIISKEKLIEIGKLALKNGFYVISDEVYKNLIFTQKKIFSLAEIEEYKQILIRVVSLSKDFNMTGWRIGFLNMPEHLYYKILNTHDALVNCTPVISQYAGLSALNHEHELLPSYLKRYSENKKIVMDSLSLLDDEVQFVEPMGTYYIFPKINGLTNSIEFCMELLHKQKVAVVPGSGFGEGGEGHVRICFGREVKDVIEGISRFTEMFLNKNYRTNLIIPTKLSYLSM